MAITCQVVGDTENKQRIANTRFMAGLNPEVVLAMVQQLRATMGKC